MVKKQTAQKTSKKKTLKKKQPKFSVKITAPAIKNGSVLTGVQPSTAAIFINLFFSIFEFVGGFLSGSVAILADAIHDFGDAVSLILDKIMKRKTGLTPDKTFTFGYHRYNVISTFATSMVMIVGSAIMILLATSRLFNPETVHPFWMIIISIVGITVNAFFTFFPERKKSSLHVTNHYLVEDILCWSVVLVAAVTILRTKFVWIDPVVTIVISVCFVASAVEKCRAALNLLLEKVPEKISVDMVRFQVSAVPHVLDVHHVHVWSLDDDTCCATLHAVVDGTVIDGILLENSVESPHNIKAQIRKSLSLLGIHHATIEIETELEHCGDKAHKRKTL